MTTIGHRFRFPTENSRRKESGANMPIKVIILPVIYVSESKQIGFQKTPVQAVLIIQPHWRIDYDL
jgi:hypothetical protein